METFFNSKVSITKLLTLISYHLAMKKIAYFLTVLSVVSLLYCKKDSHATEAVLKNLTGFDGCGWILEIKDNKHLEPENLNDFNVPLKDGQKVLIRYQTTDNDSYCMVGPTVKLLELRVLQN